jgi:hypothetical protein
MFGINFENTMTSLISEYDEIARKGKKELGLKRDSGKPLIARYVARELLRKGLEEGSSSKYVPQVIRDMINKIKSLKWEKSILIK